MLLPFHRLYDTHFSFIYRYFRKFTISSDHGWHYFLRDWSPIQKVFLYAFALRRFPYFSPRTASEFHIWSQSLWSVWTYYFCMMRNKGLVFSICASPVFSTLFFEKVILHLHQMVLENWRSACSRMKQDYYRSFCTKSTPKWIKVLKIRPDILDNAKTIPSVLQNTGIGGNFLNMASVAQAIRPNINEWNLMDLQISVC